jgi:hypothetical protein
VARLIFQKAAVCSSHNLPRGGESSFGTEEVVTVAAEHLVCLAPQDRLHKRDFSKRASRVNDKSMFFQNVLL